jgi:putative polyketide hydroxylase
MTSRDIEVPVLIVGGGPAGLTASLLLSRHGVESLLVDKRGTVSPLPRARGVHARAMEIMRVCGVEPALRAVELPITPGAQWRRRLGGPPIREDVPSATVHDQVSPCEGLAVSQDLFETVLDEHARGYPAGRLRRGVRLESFTTVDAGTVDAGVRATLRDQTTGRQSSVHARWLIAADGVHSGIRDRLGIRMQGQDDLGRQRMIGFRADLTRYTGRNPCGIYFLTDTGAALIWTHADHRWAISLPDADADDRDPQMIVRDVLGVSGLAVEVSAVNRWTAAAQNAQRYRHGPVFLIGDAAHRFPPAGATGVSTAMHDAHNLAWKLAAVWSGHAGPVLLDSYAAEREPVGRRNADETGTAWTRVFNGNGVPFAGRTLTQIDMGYQYRSAVISDDGTPDADPPGSDYRPTADPGCRAPHLRLDTPDGRTSTIDLFDRHLVLLTAPPGAEWRTAADHAARAYRLPIHSHVVSEPEWPDRYGVTPTGAVFVRPDGHVAWRSHTSPDPRAATSHAQISAALSTILATTAGPTHP